MKAYLITMVVLGILGFLSRMWNLGDFKNRYVETTQGVYAFGALVGACFTVWALFLLLNFK